MAKDKNMNQDAANDEEMTVTLTLDERNRVRVRESLTIFKRRLIGNISRFFR